MGNFLNKEDLPLLTDNQAVESIMSEIIDWLDEVKQAECEDEYSRTRNDITISVLDTVLDICVDKGVD